MAKKKKFRAEFRKNRTPRARKTDWTRQFDEHGFQEQAPETEERISGRGEMNRHRTICTSEAAAELGNAEIPFDVLLDVDLAACRRGRVLSVFGLTSTVLGDDGSPYQCATRRILKTLSTDERNPVVAGDRVLFRCGENEPARAATRSTDIAGENNTQGGPDRAGRAAARHHFAGGPRPPAGPRFQRRPVADRGQRGRAAAETEPHRSPARGRRKRPRAADHLHQQDRSDRAGELGTAGGCLQSDGLSGAVGQPKTGFGTDRLRRLVAGRESVWPGKAAWASRRC